MTLTFLDLNKKRVSIPNKELLKLLAQSDIRHLLQYFFLEIEFPLHNIISDSIIVRKHPRIDNLHIYHQDNMIQIVELKTQTKYSFLIDKGKYYLDKTELPNIEAFFNTILSTIRSTWSTK
ncbi:hypothetical protein EB001_07425 [bacterium]|nr:hypothetical protein [bacterium]